MGMMGNWVERWRSWPLYARIFGAILLGAATGLALGSSAGGLALPAKLVLRLLGAIASPLVLVAIVRALLNAKLPRGTAPRLAFLLVLNTTVAILIGLAVANLLQPGKWAQVTPAASTAAAKALPGPLEQFLDNVPRSLLGPLTDDGKVLAVILIAVALGVALRSWRDHPVKSAADLVEIAFGVLLQFLHWLVEIIPFAIFGVIASIVGTRGFADFLPLGAFVAAVVLALILQGVWYLVRVRLGSWVNPWQLVKGMCDALVMAFSTASSTATMPVTYACLKDKVGLREQSASLGALVGSNFNNDGTALYEAMSALFIAQVLGLDLSLQQQFMVVLTSIAASVGAAGIPEAGLVTMMLVFKAVGLPVEYIAILLTVDWFLDRCRTTINVMGDINVSALLDGRSRQTAQEKI